MNTIASTHDAYFHIRIVLGMVIGLAISRLLTGVARFIQHPSRQTIYPAHLGWVAFVFLTIIHFWWFEFRLVELPSWVFEIYIFVIFYACLLFLTTTMLFPDHIGEYSGYRDYFLSRRGWFFGLLAAVFVVDLADTWLKGGAYFRSFGLEYPVRNLTFVALFLAAAFIRNERFHAALVAVALVYQATWILRLFDSF